MPEVNNVIDYSFAEEYNKLPAIPAGVVILHKDFTPHKMETLSANRNRFRGSFTTAFIDSFLSRVNHHLSTESKASAGFIQVGTTSDLSAQFVFNLGDQKSAGHADDTANIVLRRTADFSGLLSELDSELSQRDFVEFLEDWAENIQPGRLGTDGEPAPFGVGAAIQAVRNIKVVQTRESSHGENELSREQATMDKIAAEGVVNNLPTYFHFNAPLFEGLPTQSIKVRVQLKMEPGEKPSFVLKAVKLQKHYELAGVNFANILKEGINSEDTPVYLGAFKAV